MPDAISHEQSMQMPRRESIQVRKLDPSDLTGLLNEWMEGDEREQRETFNTLRKSLDENRPEGYKLFP